MPSFKKNLLTDCLVEIQSMDDLKCGQADQVAVTCESFELRINDLLDIRIDLSNDASLQGHADGCLGCRQTLRQYEQLALVLGSGRSDVSVDRRSVVAQRQSKLWHKLPIVAPVIVALLAVLVVTGQHFNGTNNLETPVVAVATANLTSSLVANSPEVASSELLPAVEQVSWSSQSSVRKLQGLVDSGSDWLAVRREQAAVIQGLSDVRLDLDLVDLEARLAVLQPVLNYSGRIPALSPMQGTLCFTLGWLKKGKTADEPKLHSVPDTESELGMHSLMLRYMA